MEIIITESQLSLLLEQSNVYTDKEEYDNALEIYNEIWETYKDSIEYFNFLKSKKVNCCTGKKAEKPLNVSMIKLLLDKMNKLKSYGLALDKKYQIQWCGNNESEFTPNFAFLPNKPEYKGDNCSVRLLGQIFKKPTILKPIYKEPTELTKPVVGPNKTTSVVKYKELKSETSFAPQYKSGTPVVQIGTYFMTVPEFEKYKKSKPNTNFVKI